MTTKDWLDGRLEVRASEYAKALGITLRGLKKSWSKGNRPKPDGRDPAGHLIYKPETIRNFQESVWTAKP